MYYISILNYSFVNRWQTLLFYYRVLLIRFVGWDPTLSWLKSIFRPIYYTIQNAHFPLNINTMIKTVQPFFVSNSILLLIIILILSYGGRPGRDPIVVGISTFPFLLGKYMLISLNSAWNGNGCPPYGK